MVKENMPFLEGILSIWNHLNSAHSANEEECGIMIENVRFQFVAMCRPTRLDTTCMSVCWQIGTAVRQVLEPEASGAWDWYDLDNLPQPCSRCRGSRWRVARPVEVLRSLISRCVPLAMSDWTSLQIRDTRPSLMGELA